MPEWKPFPKQEFALMRTEYEVLYGGARGGGKSDAGIAWLLYGVGEPKYRALVIRKNYVDLLDWFDRAARIYCSPPFNAKASGKNCFEFPSGAKIHLGHLSDSGAYQKYQGHEYQAMLVEELTQIPSEELYLKLIASCRSTVKGLRPQVFCTCNPGEVGHAWVKRRFVSPSVPMTPFVDAVSGRSRIYVPATVSDNPALMEADPEYVKFLDSLPEDLKAWWRYGSWEQQKVKGAIYGDEIDVAVADNRITRVDFVRNRPVFVAFDLGLSDEQVCYFFQIIGKDIRIIDVFAANNKEFQFYASVLVESGYGVRTVYLPHDGTKRSADTLKSFKDILEENGFKVRINRRTSSIWGDIQKVRANFWRLSFDSEKLADALEHLRAYRRKWLPDKELFLDEPIHDIHSHYADALREVIMAVLGEKIEQEEKQKDPIWNNGLDTLSFMPQIEDDYNSLHSNFVNRTGGKVQY